jgi:hypothetical protein
VLCEVWFRGIALEINAGQQLTPHLRSVMGPRSAVRSSEGKGGEEFETMFRKVLHL